MLELLLFLNFCFLKEGKVHFLIFKVFFKSQHYKIRFPLRLLAIIISFIPRIYIICEHDSILVIDERWEREKSFSSIVSSLILYSKIILNDDDLLNFLFDKFSLSLSLKSKKKSRFVSLFQQQKIPKNKKSSFYLLFSHLKRELEDVLYCCDKSTQLS